MRSKIKSMEYKYAMDFLTRDNKYDKSNIGNHINFFDYEKIEKMLKDSCLDLNITNLDPIFRKISFFEKNNIDAKNFLKSEICHQTFKRLIY